MTQDSKRPYNRKKTQIDNLASAASEIGHVPPHASDIEEAVLGAMLLDTDCISDAVEVLQPRSFYDPKFRIMYETIVSMYNAKAAIDLITFTEKLRSLGKLDEVGGAYSVASLTEKVGAASHVDYYIKILQQKTIQRDLIEAAYGILRDAFDESANVDLLIENSQSNIYNAIQGNIKSEYKHVGEVVNRSLERIQQIQNSDSSLTGIASGFPSLDAITNGWQECNLIILGARPSVGKTAFSLNMARNAAVEFGVPTAYFSLEMSDMEITDRLICAESGIPADKLKNKGRLQPEDWTQLERSISKLVSSPLFIDETPGITITEFTSKAKRLVREKGVKIIFVDYLQLMHASAQQSSYREQEVSAISQALKATAKELHIPIVALSQLNRNLMNRPGASGRPVLSDLRDSGSIEQDADLVLFLHRPGMLGLDEDLTKAELIIAKHRNGRVADIELTYLGEQVKFVENRDTFAGYDFTKVDSAMNSDKGPAGSGRKAKDNGWNPQDSVVPYNPFEDFRDAAFQNSEF